MNTLKNKRFAKHMHCGFCMMDGWGSFVLWNKGRPIKLKRHVDSGVTKDTRYTDMVK